MRRRLHAVHRRARLLCPSRVRRAPPAHRELAAEHRAPGRGARAPGHGRPQHLLLRAGGRLRPSAGARSPRAFPRHRPGRPLLAVRRRTGGGSPGGEPNDVRGSAGVPTSRALRRVPGVGLSRLQAARRPAALAGGDGAQARARGPSRGPHGTTAPGVRRTRRVQRPRDRNRRGGVREDARRRDRAGARRLRRTGSGGGRAGDHRARRRRGVLCLLDRRAGAPLARARRPHGPQAAPRGPGRRRAGRRRSHGDPRRGAEPRRRAQLRGGRRRAHRLARPRRQPR